MQTRSSRRLLCRCLAGALGQTLNAKDLPANDAEWQSVLRLANAHRVTPLLDWALRENPQIPALPVGVVQFLDAFHAFNLDDNRRYEVQLAHLIQTLNGISVRPVLLKGAAAIASGLYPTSGERYIGDIDILIPPLKLAQILDQLQAVGYVLGLEDEKGHPAAEDFVGYADHHHYPALTSLDWPVMVELHTEPVLLSLTHLLGCEEVMRDARPLNWRGGECLIPSPTHFVTHTIIHAYLVDYKEVKALSLRQLFELVHASRIYAGQIDWVVIRQRFDDCQYGAELRYYAGLAVAYFGFQLPTELPIGRLTQFWTRLHYVWGGTPKAIYLSDQIIRKLQVRTRHLASNPWNLIKLLTLGFYVRFYQELIVSKKHSKSIV